MDDVGDGMNATLTRVGSRGVLSGVEPVEERIRPQLIECRHQSDHALGYENRIADDLLCVLAVEGSFHESRGTDGRGDAVGIRIRGCVLIVIAGQDIGHDEWKNVS